jgi:hypothetical protein
MDQNSEVFFLRQTFSEFEKKFKDSRKCVPNEPKSHRYQNLSINFFPPQKISVIELLFKAVFVENATINELNCTLSVSPYRNCVLIMKSPFSSAHEWIFICEFKSLEDFKNETITPTMINFSFESEKKFYLLICKIKIYKFQDDCGIPDIPLHASIRYYNQTIEYFPTSQRNKHRMIGDSVITCQYEGNWDKEPPIFEPIIKCNTDEIDRNSSVYKIIEFKNLKIFNKTEVAVIDSEILFQCNNENSFKIHVLICKENGLWIGDDLKCKL